MSDNKQLIEAEVFISSTLRIGVYLSAFVISLGLISFYLTGEYKYAFNFPTSLTSIVNGVIALKPSAIVALGLGLLILTPIFRVAASVLLFVKEKDKLYVLITLFVLIILLFSITMGKAL